MEIMSSIYHFLKSLIKSKRYFLTKNKLEDFPFDETLLSYRNKGTFPNMAIRLNPDRKVFTGGELIELKDTKNYTVSSFNSTIPTGKKEIMKIIAGESSNTKQQMEEKGEDIYSLPVRDVFYLVRGRKKGNVKACLVHGSFFETIKANDLIKQSFPECLKGINISKDIETKLVLFLLDLFEQQHIRRTEDIKNASVRVRFIPEVEVKAEGNILNPKKYPEIKDDTLNFVLPCHNDEEEKNILSKAKIVFDKSGLEQFDIFKIKHHFNGHFLVLQTSI